MDMLPPFTPIKSQPAWSLQGNGIIKSKENFRHGMLHDEAEEYRIRLECSNIPKTYENANKHHV